MTGAAGLRGHGLGDRVGGGRGTRRRRAAGNLDHLSGREATGIRNVVVLGEDVEAEAVAHVLRRQLGQRIVLLDRVTEERRAELLLRVRADLFVHLFRDVVGRVERQRLFERLAGGDLVAVLQLVHRLESELL